MPESHEPMARRIASVARELEQKRTGLTPEAVTVVQGDGTLVITLHGALSPAEKALARSAGGAAEVQEYYRQLFATNAHTLRNEIKRITGVAVREAQAEIETGKGAVTTAFASGTVVHVLLLASSIPPERWSGSGTGEQNDQLP